MRVALERTIVLHIEVSEGTPAHQVLGELERAYIVGCTGAPSFLVFTSRT